MNRMNSSNSIRMKKRQLRRSTLLTDHVPYTSWLKNATTNSNISKTFLSRNVISSRNSTTSWVPKLFKLRSMRRFMSCSMSTILSSCSSRRSLMISASLSKNGRDAIAVATLNSESSSTVTSVANWVAPSAFSNKDPILISQIKPSRSKIRLNPGSRLEVTFASSVTRSSSTVMPCMSSWVNFRSVIFIRRVWRKNCRKKSTHTTR